MYLKKLLLGAALVTTCLTPSMARAHMGPGSMGPPGMGFRHGALPPPLMMGLRAANLTPDQKKQVHTILKASRAQTAPLFEQLHSIHEQIGAKLLAAGTVTPADLAQLQQQANSIHDQIEQKNLETAVQVRNLLNPDQLAKVAQFNQKMSAIHAEIENLMKQTGQPGPGDDEPAPAL